MAAAQRGLLGSAWLKLVVQPRLRSGHRKPSPSPTTQCVCKLHPIGVGGCSRRLQEDLNLYIPPCPIIDLLRPVPAIWLVQVQGEKGVRRLLPDWIQCAPSTQIHPQCFSSVQLSALLKCSLGCFSVVTTRT